MDDNFDDFGVQIDNEIDVIRFRYLLAVVGDKKLKISIDKYHKKWPSSKPYVSLLLKWHRVVVPTHLYSERNVPVYYVYLLVNRRNNVVKVGVSGNLPSRIKSFSENFEVDGFDVGESIAVLFHSNRKCAFAAERHIKKKFKAYKAVPPSTVKYGVGGRNEWFSLNVLSMATDELSSFESSCQRRVIPVSDLLKYDEIMRDNAIFFNA